MVRNNRNRYKREAMKIDATTITFDQYRFIFSV